MDYIECTHCGKQFAVSDRVRESEGKFVTCTACHKDFLIVINSEETNVSAPQRKPMVTAEGWDPSVTAPVAEDEQVSKPAAERSLNDDDKSLEILGELQAAKKKRSLIYSLIALAVCLLALGFLLINGNETIEEATPVTTETVKHIEVKNENRPECRQEAAKQWLIDYQAMHGEYSADEFVRILKRSEQQLLNVKAQCENQAIIQEIITAATEQVKPAWFAAEINLLQANRDR